MIFCSFGFYSCHSRIFHTYGDLTITSEGLQILTHAWHLFDHWAVRVLSVPKLLWHQFIKVISEDPWHSHLLQSVLLWSCHYLFLQIYVCRGLDSKTQPSPYGANDLTDCVTTAAHRIEMPWRMHVHLIMFAFLKEIPECAIYLGLPELDIWQSRRTEPFWLSI